MPPQARFVCASFVIALTLPVVAAADILLVNADGTGQYPTIQAAIDAAVDGDEVHLETGIYQGEGNREIRYHGKAITVRSETGDPSDVSIFTYDPKDSKRAFIFDDGEGASSILSGISTAAEWISEGKVAILCEGSSPRITNCRFVGGQGTAVRSRNGKPTLESCHFEKNQSVDTSTCIEADSAVVRDCTFVGNFNDGSAGAASIGCASIYNCVFSENSTWAFGGSLTVGPGSVIEDTTIGGWAKYSCAAICVGGPAVFRRCMIYEGSNGTEAMGVSGCITLQDCFVESISPPDACIRRITSKATPADIEPFSTEISTWGRIKASYR